MGEADGSTRWWRTLAEGLDPEALAEVSAELPYGAEAPAGFSRRDFLQLLSASVALAGLSCFEAPAEKILPYASTTPEVVPGRPTPYATALELDGFGRGVIAESREGRPVKVEGNPEHPASLGAAGVFEQAALLGLYDPFRARGLELRGKPAPWDALRKAFGPESRGRDGGLRVLLEPTASPLLRHLIANLRERRPAVRLHFYAPLRSSSPLEAARTAFGRPARRLYEPDRAARILAADADFLGSGPLQLRYGRTFARRRRIRERDAPMSRLYAMEPAPSVTGSVADHAVPTAPHQLGPLLAAVLLDVADGHPDAPAELPTAVRPLAEAAERRELARAVARDLRAHPGEALVIVGSTQPVWIHLLGDALNVLLGAEGRTLRTVEPVREPDGTEGSSLRELGEAIRDGSVERLLILGGNPAYASPGSLEFGDALSRVPLSAYLGTHADETAQRSDWLVPQLHPFEAWGDTAAPDGTASLVQPLIAPLWWGRTRADLLALLAGDDDQTAHQLLRGYWRGRLGAADGDAAFEQALRQGRIEGTAAPEIRAEPRWPEILSALQRARPEAPQVGRVELSFRPDASVHDGRFAGNPWLQEMPDPVTKLTWDNAAWIAPSLALRQQVESGDWLSIRHDGRTLEIPALVVPGLAEGTVALHFGYGRGGDLPVAGDVGFDVYRLWSSEAEHHASDAELEPLRDGRDPHPLATTQGHFNLDERHEQVVQETALADYRHPDVEPHPPHFSLYDAARRDSPQWGMAVDLTLCTGCSACVVACQAENNVPVVGKQGVLDGREMHWIRIDRYYTGPVHEPRPVSQPMLCQHCEKAPCEYVCPVNATVHSSDGLNEMIYNRCVGTRFCSNNCPYKVRRFNWFDYNSSPPEVRRMQFNPEVTVRSRGVMEKCTYCVQRIRRAELEAGREDRPLRDGEVRTACQQACPTEAIVFGDLRDPGSAVSRTLEAPQTYSVLRELGTRPRTRYLARIHNPNEDLARLDTPSPGGEPRGKEG